MTRPQFMSDKQRTKDDETLSRRHRTWGHELHATDIDYLVENSYGRPVAIIEYKKNTGTVTQNQHKTLQTLADMAGLPFFVVWTHQ